MPITRVFLDWTQPALPAAADFLLDKYSRGQEADLSEVVVVLQSSRAGRRLLELLVNRCDERHSALAPPLVTTVGRFPELLYNPKRPFAEDLVQRLAWTSALRATDQQLLRHVVARLPVADDQQRWMELGELLQGLHRELSSNAFDFADIAAHAAALEGKYEQNRWQALASIQQTYLRTLDDLQLWDRQTARRVAIQQQECASEREIVLLGAVDINEAMRRMLDSVADRVTALIVAPRDFSDRFDQHGCLLPAAWESTQLPIDDAQISLADDVVDQAEATVRRIAELEGRYRADEISIGVADERMVAQLERQLEQCDLPARWGPGRAITGSSPYRLFSAVAAYLRSGRYREFAALGRHPDLFVWLSHRQIDSSWLAQLDDYYNRYLPNRLGKWRGGKDDYADLRAAHEAIDNLVAPLSGRKPLPHWGEPLGDLIHVIYAHRLFDRDIEADRQTLNACEQIYEALLGFAHVPASLAPTVAAHEAIQLALGQVAASTVAAPAADAAIELLGWLELALDDAPALIVTGFNEGFVPKSVTFDLFLPNRLRQRLGLEDNARRYARDAYSLHVLAASREELRLVVGRRDVEDNPLSPSRLLFAADRETIARRALRFFDTPSEPTIERPLVGGLDTSRGAPDFPVPRPRPLGKPIKAISPSSAKAYLACPYRFYLSHVMNLEAVDDTAAELDGALFGNLAHDVLLDFARSERRHSTDVAEIAEVLDESLDRQARAAFGKHALTPIGIQIEQLRLRLRAFAAFQADWTAQGWLIEHYETASDPAPVMVDGEPILLHGRIDRIDRHQQTGQWFIIDYKTGDAGQAPDRVHRRRDEWVDLQLPLYRHLARSLGIEEPIRLGYILLPKDISSVGLAEAEWNSAELAAADETFNRVVRAIRREVFWPPTDPPPDFAQWLARICQDKVFDRSPSDELEEATP